MKLKHIILPIMAAFLLFSGCTKEVNYYGAQIETYRFNINPAEWIRVEGNNLPGANNYLYCTKEIPAINSEVFNYGNVQAYVWNVYDGQNNLGAWNTLPFVYPLEVYYNNDDGTQSMEVVPENLRFEWELGKVTFIIQDLDGYDPLALGDGQTLSFKVSISHNM
ncbi:MAG: hypothetical protein IKK04_00605 [Bacteroidales bacterium]|nr:hypothetical protein [Bacteroidales bacterium]